MGSDTELTPMMAQYRRIKGELPGDALLLFRLGDFYELFFEDARIGAQLLNVALTKRGAVPMCGIPFHAAGGYVAIVGHKVADTYGVWQEKSMMGRKYMGNARTTFVIDRDGRIAQVFEKVKPEGHAAAVAEAVAAL